VTPDQTPGTPPIVATPPKPIVRLGSATATGKVVSVRIAASIDGGPATERLAYARRDQAVKLYAVVTVDDGKVFSDAQELHVGGKPLAHKPIAEAPLVELRWNRIEAAAASMTNGNTPAEFHFEPIDYRATPLTDGVGSVAVDVRPTLTPDRVVASAGPEARRGKGSGGLTDAVMRVTIRRDDTYLGYLTEMYGQPYIWASEGLTDATHQSERLEGSDCADFVIYGMRRMGKKLRYTWSGGLPEVTQLLGAGKRDDDGVYRDKKGAPLPYTKAGDLVLFPRHVGVLVTDRGQLGVLDDQDIMMHTLFDTPKEVAIADSGYADKDLELRRFR
jgi:hypothetical protein